MIVDKHQYATLSHGILWMLHISNLFHNLISILCQNAVRQNNEPKKKEMEIDGQIVRIAFWDAIFCAVCVLANVVDQRSIPCILCTVYILQS